MNTTLKVNNDFSYLITSDTEFRNKLWEKLRFRQRNYFHTRAFQQGIWDGFIDFMQKKTGRFLTGLLPEIELALNYFNIPYTINDERKHLDFAYQSIDKDFLKQWTPKGTTPLELYDYQVDAVNQAIKHGRGIVKLPTGSGKTAVMIAILKALPPNTPTLFLVNRKTLVSQNYKEMIKWGLDKVGRFNSDYHEPNLITCANVQSLHHLDRLLSKFRVLITDEIHMMSNNSGIRAFKKLIEASIRIGVSATPFKFGEKDLVQKYTVKGYFGPVFTVKSAEGDKITTSALQNRGNLSGSKCLFYYIDAPQIPYDIWVDAVTNGIANNMHFHKIVAKLAGKLDGRTLIMVDRIAHGDELNNMIPGSLWVRGQDNEKTRDYVIDQLKQENNKVIAIATRQIFDTGVNFFLHNFINATDASSEHGVIQLMGRGLRPASDKDVLNYYDFIFRINPYLEKHSNDRIKILRKEKHDVIIMDKIDF